MLEELLFKILKREVPTAEENQIHHQLEYLKVRSHNGLVELEGANYQCKPRLLGPFKELESRLPKFKVEIVDAYQRTMDILLHAIRTAIQSLEKEGVQPESIWLNKSRNEFVNNPYIYGLAVVYHNNYQEFALSLQYSRAFPLDLPKDYAIQPREPFRDCFKRNKSE
jgi:hypothetical protein